MAERGRRLRVSRHPDGQAPNPRSRAPGEQVRIASRPARAGERNGRPGGGRPSSPRSHVSPSQAAAGLHAGGREAGSPSAASASPQPCRMRSHRRPPPPQLAPLGLRALLRPRARHHPRRGPGCTSDAHEPLLPVPRRPPANERAPHAAANRWSAPHSSR